MADKRISQLVDRGTVVNNDVVPIVVSGAVTTNKATISSIQTFMQGNLDLGVTSVGITFGTTGTDINASGSPVTSSGNITINLPTASAVNRGALSSADWSTFNGKQPAGNYVTLDTDQTITAQKTFSLAGASDTVIITKGSGAGFALDVIKAGNGETLRVTKTSGTGNAMTVIGGNFEAPTIVKTGGTSSQFLKADGSVDSSTYYLASNPSGFTTNLGTVTSVAATASTGISISGSPITSSGTLTITNTAPDQVVALTASTGISVSGTYPNFTITNTSPASVTSVGITLGSTGTDVNVSGSPVTSSGNITINLPTASATNRGALSSADWTTFNNKTSNLGTVTSVAALTIGTTGTNVSSSVANGTTTPVITLNIPTASAANRGALSSADWTTFNNKTSNVGTVTSVAATAGTGISVSGSPITTSGTLTITNTAPDQTVALTAGTGISTSGTYPNFTITNTSPSSGGTVTSVAAITLGTTGTDLSSTVATGTTTPVITLQVPTASAANRGALSSADWTTFNNKTSNTGTVTSVGLSSATSGVTIASTPVTTSGTITIAIATATSGQNGLLSSTDWSTFNSKQSTITLTTTGTSGAATLVGSTLNVPNYADGGVLSLSAIGGTPNANAATITGTVLNLQPASASFGGVVTTGSQTFAGAKTLTGSLSGTSATFSSTINTSGNIQIDGVSPLLIANASSTSYYGGLSIRLSGTEKARFAANITSGAYVYSPTFNGFGILSDTINPLVIASTGGATFSGQIKTTFAGQSISINAASTDSVRIQLQNNSIGNAGIVVENSVGGDQFSGTTAYAMAIGTFTAKDLFLGTNSAQRFKLDGTTGAATFSSSVAAASGAFSGGVTVTSASTTGVVVNSTSGASYHGYRIQNSGTDRALFETNANNGEIKIGSIPGDTSDYFPVIYSDGVASLTFGLGASPSAAFVGSVTATGFFQSSDLRKKNVIKRDGDVAYYTWKDGIDQRQKVGYIAQEVQEYMPDAVNEDHNGMLSIDYIQVLVSKIKDLETKLKRHGLE